MASCARVAKMFCLVSLVSAIWGVSCALSDPGLSSSPGETEVTCGAQKVTFTKEPSGEFRVDTFVRDSGTWKPMFDGRRPLVIGPDFDLKPTTCQCVADTPQRKAVLLTGRQATRGYNWDVLVEATAGSPFIRFLITCHLATDLTISVPQPAVALWTRRPSAAVTVDQGPESIYGRLGVLYGMGFPAAYLWEEGREAVVFFNPTPSVWMSPQGVWRFFDARVQSRSVDGQTGLGLHVHRLSGATIPRGDMVIDFSLYSGPRADRPTRLQALDTMVRRLAPLHPATSVLPRNRLENMEVSWAFFARRAIEDLMVPGASCATRPCAWDDPPLHLVPPIKEFLGHDGRIGPAIGDFSCTNNHLSAWVLYCRLNPDAPKAAFARRKKDQLPLYYDPQATLIRWGTREPPQVGDLEMAWQNLFFHLETLRTCQALSPEEFNPAIGGRFLMATRGLLDLAHNVKYVFPQWFDPYRKIPVVQNDVKALGTVREPWQVGTYAYLMLQAQDLTGEDRFGQEARTSIETLLARMSYRETNAAYDRTYTDPADFPLTELFGQAFGTVAAGRLYERTGDERFLRYSRDFLNGLLRLTPWYEDEADPICRELRSAGLFYPHGGATVPCPWETTEAHLAIAWAIRHDPQNPLLPLLVKLSNLNRINSFYFYPATYSPAVAALDASRRRDLGQYWPIEPFYTLEGNGGHRGSTAAYMAGNAIWNWWMYEALAQTDDREVMVLNPDVLDDYEPAICSAVRHLVVLNPTASPKRITLISKALASGRYGVTLETANSEPRSLSSSEAELAAGLPLALEPMQSVRITICHEQCDAMLAAIRRCRHAQARLACSYAVLQQRAWGEADAPSARQYAERFQGAMKEYRNSRYEAAARQADQMAAELRS